MIDNLRREIKDLEKKYRIAVEEKKNSGECQRRLNTDVDRTKMELSDLKIKVGNDAKRRN